jgi:probable F420-dependent oxidoreductase
MELGRLGVWWSRSWRAEDASLDVAAELEEEGFTALWSSGGFDPGLSKHFDRLLASTSHIAVASGIVSIWASPPDVIAVAAQDLEDRYPGRFLLGLGASHAPLVGNYEKPYSKMVEFLDGLDNDGPAVAVPRRALAALGNRMLELARDRSLGAHPYFVPAEHTARARSILGPRPLLAPEVTVVLETDPTKARELARTFTAGYLSLQNYRQNLLTLGFGEDDVVAGGSNRLVDAVVAWGDPGTIAAKVRKHYEAGADHVCIQVIPATAGPFPIAELREIAPAILDL